jgi:hypothetical protein
VNCLVLVARDPVLKRPKRGRGRVRVEVLQGVRQMRFEGCSGGMSRASCRGGNGGDAGVLERPFRRWRDRLGDDGPERLRDRRIGKLSSREPSTIKGPADLTGRFRRA